MSITITREELYEKVWSTPMRTLAKEYGLSDVGLAKICKKMEVPRPERGYWAKVEAGKKVPARPRLKNLKKGVNQVTITPTKKNESTIGEKREVEVIPVPTLLSRPHSLTEKTQAALKTAKTNERGILIPRNKTYLDIQVTQESSDRAYLVMDTLVKALEKRDLEIKIEKGNPAKTIVIVDGEKVEIGLEEKIRQVEIIPTAEEKKRNADNWWWRPGHEYKPTGKLTLRILNYLGRGIQQNWSDGKVQQVEDCLGRLVNGLYQAAAAIKQRRIEHEERERLWAERERQAKERRRLEYIEEKKIEKLTKELENWNAANSIRRYLDEVAKKAEGQDGIMKWIEWGRSYADKLDPLNSMQKLPFDEESISYWY